MFLFYLLFLSFSFEAPTLPSLQSKAEKKDRYLYCLCPVKTFDRCKKDLACDTYQVPQDNYITMDSQDAFSTISKYNNSDITIYLTSPSSSSEVFYISLVGFENSNNILRFNTVDLDSPPNINLREKSLTYTGKFQCLIQGVRSVSIDQMVANVISVLTLKNSPMSIDELLNIQTLITDSQSIKSYLGTINIIENLTLDGATPVQITGNLNLNSGSSLTLDQSSSFPLVSLRNPIKSDDSIKLYVYLSDQYEDNTIRIGIQNEDAKSIYFRETSNKVPSITVWNRFEGEADNLGILHFEFLIPSQGMNLMFNKTSASDCIQNFPKGFDIAIREDKNDKQESNNDASLLQLSLDPICGDNPAYPITVIEGPINLRLMTSTTVQAILNLIEGNDLSISNLDSLTINVENYLTEISFTVYGIKLALGGGDQKQNKKTLQDAESGNSITLRNNISESFYLICSSTEINFKIEDNPEFIHLITIIIQTENANLKFAPKFINKYANNITIDHGSLPVTISTTADYVPTVNFEDEILNISYESNKTTVDIPNQADANKKEQRAGPKVTYNLGPGGITFSQDVCLAEDVTFDGNDFKFDYINESISSYTFNKNVCITNSKSESNVFKANKVTFAPSAGFLDTLDSSQCQIDATIGDLSCHFSAIPSDAFTDSIKIERSLIIGSNSDPENVNQIFFSSNAVRIGSSAKVQQINYKGTIPNFTIYLNGQSQVTLSYESSSSNSKSLLASKELAQNISLYIHGDPADIYIDKSWYQVNIPDSFKIILDGADSKANIHTELIEMPNFSFYYNDGNKLVARNDFNYSNHEEPFVKTTGFKVLIAFAVIIGAAIIVGAIIGIVYAVKRKKSGKERLEDSNRNTDHILI